MIRNITILLICIGIMVGGYFGYRAYNQSHTPANPYTTETLPSTQTYEEMKLSKEEQVKKDLELYTHATKQNDGALCESIIDNERKIRCHDMVTASIALGEQKQEKCISIQDTSLRTRCEDNIIYAIASSGTTRSICSGISDTTLRGQCEYDIDTKIFTARLASGTVDEAFCAVLSGDLMQTCNARITRTTDQDVYRKAINTKDIALCNSLDDESLKGTCRDTLILEMALRDKNSDLCQNISNPEKSKFCTQSLQIQNEALLYQEIVTSGDISRCSTLENKNYREQCHDVIVMTLVQSDGDTGRCTTLYNTGMLTSCQHMVSKQ